MEEFKGNLPNCNYNSNILDLICGSKRDIVIKMMENGVMMLEIVSENVETRFLISPVK